MLRTAAARVLTTFRFLPPARACRPRAQAQKLPTTKRTSELTVRASRNQFGMGLNMSPQSGNVVLSVEPGGMAAKDRRLRPGDVITSLDGEPLGSVKLAEALRLKSEAEAASGAAPPQERGQLPGVRTHMLSVTRTHEVLTEGSAPTIFYTFEKMSARVQPSSAAHLIPRSPHSPCVVPFEQLSTALGSRKLRNPTKSTHQNWMYPCVRLALVRFPSILVAFRAVVGPRGRAADFRSMVAIRAGVSAPGCVSCQHGRTFAPL